VLPVGGVSWPNTRRRHHRHHLGCLLPSSTFLNLGLFRDDYFIDYVDTEYCLRALSQGYRMLSPDTRTCTIGLGQESGKLGPLHSHSNHACPVAVVLHGAKQDPHIGPVRRSVPHWCMFDLMHGAYAMMRMLVSEDKRLEKLAAFARGTWHGLRGRLGPMPGRFEQDIDSWVPADRGPPIAQLTRTKPSSPLRALSRVSRSRSATQPPRSMQL